MSARPLLAAVVIAVVALTAAAAPPPPQFADTVVVTATGAEEPSDEVPAPVTVIERSELEAAQTDTVADALRRVPGLLVARSGPEGSLASVFTRGTESDHTLVLLDGVRLNSPYFGGYDWSGLMTAGLERIEVVRGPYSALWGADALGGAVNLVPRSGVPGAAGDLRVEGGGDAWRRAEASLVLGGPVLDLFVAGAHREGEGELANSDFTTRQWLLDAGRTFASGVRVAVVAQHLDAETGVPLTGGAPTPAARQASRQTVVAAPLTVDLGGRFVLELTPAAVRRDLGYRNPDDPFGFTASDTAADTLQARGVVRWDGAAHTVSVGGDWRRDEVTDLVPWGANLSDETSRTTGVFVQDHWRPSRRVRVVAGLRWDDAGAWGAEVSPRANVGWEVRPGLELRAGYGEAFRQPSVGELYFPYYGNPELEPEVGRTGEVGAAWRAGSALRLEAALFRTRLERLIEYDYAAGRFRNVLEAAVDGAELAATAALTDRLHATAQVTLLDTSGAGDEPLLRRPDVSGSVTVGGTLSPRLEASVTLLAVGARDDVDPATYERTRVGSHAVADAAVAWRAADGWWLTVRAVNLADRDYQEVLGYPAPGRRVMAGVRAAFD